METVAVNHQMDSNVTKGYLTPELSKQLENEFYDLLSDLRYGIEQYKDRNDYAELIRIVNRIQLFNISDVKQRDVEELSTHLLYLYTATNLGGIVKNISKLVVEFDPYLLELRNKSTDYDKVVAKNIIERFKDSRFLTDEQKIGIDILKDVDGMPILMCKDFDAMSNQNQEFANEYIPIAVDERRKADEKFRSEDEKGWQ